MALKAFMSLAVLVRLIAARSCETNGSGCAVQGPALLQRHHAHVESSVHAETRGGHAETRYGAGETPGDKIISAVDQCLSGRVASAVGDEKTLRRLHLVRTAEILTRLLESNLSVSVLGPGWIDSIDFQPVIDAALVAGRDAALFLAREEFEEAIADSLGTSNLTEGTIQDFASKITRMGELCGQGDEAQALARDEVELLSGNISIDESRLAMEVAEYVENLCRSEVLDVDFFVGKLVMTPDCSHLMDTSLLSHMTRETHKLEYYAKSALVLHSSENKLGHYFVQHLRGEVMPGDSQLERALLDAAHSSAQQGHVLSQLRYIEDKHFQHVYGMASARYCDANAELLQKSPGHWISKNREIQDYVDCLCIRHLPALLCDAQHRDALEKVRPILMAKLTEAKAKMDVTTAATAATAPVSLLQKTSAVGFGPCQDSDGKPTGVDCQLTINGVTINREKEIQFDPYAMIAPFFDRTQSCIEGSCTACMGIKPGDPVAFYLTVGADGACNDRGSLYAEFRLFAQVDMCLGGVIGEIADAIGWDHCNTVGTLEYFPFISKMTVAIELPIPLPFPLSVRAFLDSNLRLAALTKVVRDYCDGFSHSPSAHFNCHFTFLNAQGFTFVDIGVEILLGIKIPLLGTIGKWVKILGFGVAEEDKAKEIAMNRADVTVVFVGKSSHNQKCGVTYSSVDCEPFAGNLGHRANPSGSADTFEITPGTTGPRSLCIRRTDHSAGWGMNLEIACKVDNSQPGIGIITPIGTSKHAKKCRIPDAPVDCAANSGNPGKRMGFDNHQEEYVVTKDGDYICAEVTNARRRRRSGWSLNLAIECPQNGADWDWIPMTVRIGQGQHHSKCVFSAYEMQCDRNAGDPHKRLDHYKDGVVDQFDITTHHAGRFVCAKRIDGSRRRRGSKWDQDLKIQCRAKRKFYKDVLQVRIGSQRRRQNARCVETPNRTPVECLKQAGERGKRLNYDNNGDNFEIYTLASSGQPYRVCAKRIDRGGGWGLDLKVACGVL